MKENTATARTMEVVLAEIKDNITSFNLSTDVVEKAKLEVALKNLENEYNGLSRLVTWAKFMEAEVPMVAFAKAYEYDIIGHKDAPREEVDAKGVKTVKHTRVVDESKTRILNVQEFIEWTEGSANGSVAHDKKWRTAVNEARDSIVNQWKGFMAASGDTRKVSIRQMQIAIQKMVDSLVYIEGEKGGNAVIVKSSIVKAAFAFCTQRKDGLKGSIMPASVWKKLQMDILHAAVAGKEFTISYDDEDIKEPAAEAATEEAASETK